MERSALTLSHTTEIPIEVEIVWCSVCRLTGGGNEGTSVEIKSVRSARELSPRALTCASWRDHWVFRSQCTLHRFKGTELNQASSMFHSAKSVLLLIGFICACFNMHTCCRKAPVFFLICKRPCSQKSVSSSFCDHCCFFSYLKAIKTAMSIMKMDGLMYGWSYQYCTVL